MGVDGTEISAGSETLMTPMKMSLAGQADLDLYIGQRANQSIKENCVHLGQTFVFSGN